LLKLWKLLALLALLVVFGVLGGVWLRTDMSVGGCSGRLGCHSGVHQSGV
jgi:hypothetical protein